jgi:hypothetical protein
MIVLPSERRGRGYDSIESCDRLPLSQTLLAVVLFLPLSPPIDQRQGAIRTEIESRDSGNGRLPGVLVRFASDSPLEEGGFETSVPRHGEVRAAHYSISGGVCGTGSGAALFPARRDDMIERIHSAVTVTPPASRNRGADRGACGTARGRSCSAISARPCGRQWKHSKSRETRTHCRREPSAAAFAAHRMHWR